LTTDNLFGEPRAVRDEAQRAPETGSGSATVLPLKRAS